MSKTVQNSREKLVELTRGFYAVPIISYLGLNGILDKWQNKIEIKVEDYPHLGDNFRHILRYLESLDLLDYNSDSDFFTVSTMGEKIFAKHGAFNIIHSYEDYFQKVGNLLSTNNNTFNVERTENVYGSGQVHEIKFFTDALKLIDPKVTTHIDIACGNGRFMELVSYHLKNHRKSYGIDLSEKSIISTEKNLKKTDFDYTLLQHDGLDVLEWSKKIGETKEKGLISFWFFLHEISNGNTENIINLFQQIYECYPTFDILLCENVDVDSVHLKNECGVVPEFLLFHKLSKQGVLSWSEYNDVLENIPFTLVKEIQYDTVGIDKIPSSFTWYLTPKG
jgi:hypothetical protein